METHDHIAEGSDDDLGVDVDYNSDNSEGIIVFIIKILRLYINYVEPDDMDTEELPPEDTSHSSEPVMSQPAWQKCVIV